MIYLHKILPLLVSPLTLVLSLILISSFTQRRIFSFAAIALLYVLSMPIVANKLFSSIESGYVKSDPDSLPNAEAIVVLSGMIDTIQTSNGIGYEWEDPDRFFGGLALYKLHKAERLIFTGGRLPWQTDSLPEGEILKKYAVEMGVNERDISIAGEVENTAQEASAVKKLLPGPEPHILLVTSAFHMSRAKYLFERTGLIVTEFPVDFRTQRQSLTPMSFLPYAAYFAKSEAALREALGRIYYQIRDIF